MKGVLKWLLGGIAALLVLAVAAVALLTLFFDPNAFKPQIEKLAREQAGIDLTIGGEIGWSIYPWLGLEVNEIEARQLSGEPLASLDQAQLSVRLPALLQGQVQMSGILINGLDLSLVRDQSGQANWEQLGPKAAGDSGQTPAAKGAEPKGPAAGEAAAEKAATPLQLDIAAIELNNAHVLYEDRQQGLKVELEQLNLTATEVVSGDFFPLKAEFRISQYQGGPQPAMKVAGSLASQLLLDLEAQAYQARELALDLTLEGAPFGGKRIPLSLQSDVQVDLAKGLAKLSDLQLKLASLRLNGEITAENFTAEPKLTGNLNVPAFNARTLLESLGQAVPETARKDALTQVGLSARLEGPANTLGLQGLKIQLDDTQFNGQAGFQLASGHISTTLKGTRLNLDHYLPPAAEKPATAAGQQSAPAPGSGQPRYSKAPLLPVETLKTLNFAAQLDLDELLASGISIQKLQVVAKASGGLIEAPTLKGQLYSGSFSNRATIDARRTLVRLTIHKEVQNIQLGGLLKDLAQSEQFTGRFTMSGDYSATGNSVHDIVNSLDGNLKLNLADGRLQGVNLVDKLCRGLVQLRGGQVTDANIPDYTEFSNLSGSMRIDDGVVNNQDLVASLAGVSLTGKGQVNLPAETLDYGLSLTVLQELKGPNCQIEEKLHNLAFPVRCAGSFDTKPTKLCGPDTQAMKQVIADLAKREVKGKVEEKVEQKLQEKLGDKLQGEGVEAVKGALKGLFQ